MSGVDLRLVRWQRMVLLAPMAALMAIFFYTIGATIWSSFAPRGGAFSLAIYRELLSSPVIIGVILRTINISLMTTAWCVVLGYPLALFISQARNPNLLFVILITPWMTSIIVRTFGWIVLLGNRGVINQTLMDIGLIDRPIRLIFTQLGTVIGLVHVLLPFMVISILSVLLQMDRRYTEAGMSLGAGRLETFLRVTLPLSLPGIISGVALVYLLASGVIVTPLLLGGVRDRMMGTQIFQEIFGLFNFERAAAMATILMITSLAIVLPVQLVDALARRRIRGD